MRAALAACIALAAAPPAAAQGGDVFGLAGPLEQGALVAGALPAGSRALTLDGRPVAIAPDGRFVIAFDRDAPPQALLQARLPNGSPAVRALSVAPRAWRIEQVDAPFHAGKVDAEFDALRPAELAAIATARAQPVESDGWRQAFAWPVHGRQTGWFGAQRVYQGRPGSYHGGADVAVPTGTAVRAPADGVVILAADHPYTLEGNLLMIGHGMGLSSAFLHLSRIVVATGQHVRQGDVVAYSGATGRATGPHLHWGITWQTARLDPLLVAGPVPAR